MPIFAPFFLLFPGFFISRFVLRKYSDIYFICWQYSPLNKITFLLIKQQKKIYQFLAHTGFLKCYLNLKEESFLNKNISLVGLFVLVIAEFF